MTDRPELSAIPRAQDALARMLRSRGGVGKIPVGVGWPAGGPKATQIWVDGKVEEWAQKWATSGQLGPAGIDETFTLTVNLLAVRRTRQSTYTTARDAAAALLLELQQALRADHTLEGALGDSGLATITGPGEWSEGADDEARTVLIEAKVACTAYLTTTGGQ